VSRCASVFLFVSVPVRLFFESVPLVFETVSVYILCVSIDHDLMLAHHSNQPANSRSEPTPTPTHAREMPGP